MVYCAPFEVTVASANPKHQQERKANGKSARQEKAPDCGEAAASNLATSGDRRRTAEDDPRSIHTLGCVRKRRQNRANVRRRGDNRRADTQGRNRREDGMSVASISTHRGSAPAKTVRIALNGYLSEQLSLIARKAGKTPSEMICLFVAERCNAPASETLGKGRIFNAQKVQCTSRSKTQTLKHSKTQTLKTRD